MAALNLKGLQGAIGLSVTHPTWQRTRPDDADDAHTGWAFRAPGDPPISNPAGFGSFDCEGCIPDDVNGARFVRDLYELAGDTNGTWSLSSHVWSVRLVDTRPSYMAALHAQASTRCRYCGTGRSAQS